MTPRISIIVPVYNVESYLPACLDSIIAQTLKDIEIICVNDGSTDGCARILEEYAARDARIRVIHQQNGGLSCARNSGLRAATADYVTFVDSDDWIEPRTYERVLAAMGDEVDYVCYGVVVDGNPGAQERRVFERYFKHSVQGVVPVREELLASADAIACNKVFRRSLIEQYAISFPVGVRYEDNYFLQAYGMMSRNACYVPEAFYHYVRRTDSIMQIKESGDASRGLDRLRIISALHEYVGRHALGEKFGRLVGLLFFDFLHQSLREAVTAEAQDTLFREADVLAERLHVEAYRELSYYCNLLQRRTWPGHIRRYCLGLITSKQKHDKNKLSICGVPLLTLR